MGTGGAAALLSPEFCADASAQNSGGLKISDCQLQIVNLHDRDQGFQRTSIANLQFEISNRQLLDRWHLHTGSKLEIRMTNPETSRLRFGLEIFHFPLLLRRIRSSVLEK
jgi:hypothetical protein